MGTFTRDTQRQLFLGEIGFEIAKTIVLFFWETFKLFERKEDKH